MEAPVVAANPQQFYQALQAFSAFAHQFESNRRYRSMLSPEILRQMTNLDKNQIPQILL